MNKNVWVAECDDECEKCEIIELETKHGKTVECGQALKREE